LQATLSHKWERVRLLALVQAAPNQLFDCVGIFSQLVVPEADDAVAMLCKPFRSRCVILSM